MTTGYRQADGERDPPSTEEGDDMAGNRRGGTLVKERGGATRGTTRGRTRAPRQGNEQQVARSIQRRGSAAPGRARTRDRRRRRPAGWGNAAVAAAAALAGVIVGVATARRRP
ncbi:MAG TPA: hypothetical protein VGP31_04480 [Planosporangium sp.]|jgi:hypothetical protein|nr:hypothetical protein [Planosporangium sp.]